MVGLGSLVWWASVSVSGGCCVVVGSGGGGRGAKSRVGGCALCWVGLGSVVVGLGSLVWWASVSVSGGCCVVVVVVGGRSQGWVGVRWVLGGVCFEAWAKILPRWYISGHLKILRIISGNMLYY